MGAVILHRPLAGRPHERVGSDQHGLSASGIDRLEHIAPRARLWQLRGHRLGAGVFRKGRKRGAGGRADGSRVRRGHQFLRHRRRCTAAAAARPISADGCRRKAAAARQQLLLSSKVFNRVGPGPNDRGLSRRHILRQVDESLARLQTDRLDLYLIHEPDPDTPLEETLGALDDLVRMGKVLYVGASNIEAWRLARGLVDQRRAPPGPLRVGAELIQPARSHAGARTVSALRRSRGRLHGVQSALGRLVDRKVSIARRLPGRIADDASAGAVPTPRVR